MRLAWYGVALENLEQYLCKRIEILLREADGALARAREVFLPDKVARLRQLEALAREAVRRGLL